MVEKSEALEKLYYEYTHLPLGGKFVRCPYWSNKQRILLSGPYKGKGTPAQIVKATIEAAKKEKIDLGVLSCGEVRRFMEQHRIGVDCSGFVYHMVDALSKERIGKGIFDFIEGIGGKGVTKVNAFCLTNEKNSIPIKKVKEVKVGDLIRFQDGKHVAIILRIKRDKKNNLQEIIYAHSGRLSAITGVHVGRIKVLNPEKDIGDQKWFEKTRKGYEYVLRYYSKMKGDGLKRLKIFI